MVISPLSIYMGKPTQSHWEQAKRVLRYLNGTTDRGTLYGSVQSTNLFGYSDADHASDGDGRRSHTGLCFHVEWGCSELAEPKAAKRCTVNNRGRVHGIGSSDTRSKSSNVLRQLMEEMQQQQQDGTSLLSNWELDAR